MRKVTCVKLNLKKTDGVEGAVFMRYWKTLCKGIETTASVIRGKSNKNAET
jgi:hypothetical protein